MSKKTNGNNILTILYEYIYELKYIFLQIGLKVCLELYLSIKDERIIFTQSDRRAKLDLAYKRLDYS